MAETDKKYRAGYYYAVEPKERINESDKYIHGLTFEVVFRIYDRDGKRGSCSGSFYTRRLRHSECRHKGTLYAGCL